MLIASSAYFVCKGVNGDNKAIVVLFDSDLQTHRNARKNGVLWQDSRWKGKTLKQNLI